MKRQPVSSSMISSIGYEPESKTLEIEFNTGAVWQYLDFPKKSWKDFKNADSIGRYFRDYIQDSYEEVRIARKRY